MALSRRIALWAMAGAAMEIFRLWAAHTGKIDASAPLSQQAFGMILKAQGKMGQIQLQSIGIVDAASLEAKRKALGAAAARTPESVAPWAHAGRGPWRLDPRFVSWPMVFTHACEHRQALAKLGAEHYATLVAGAAQHVVEQCAAQLAVRSEQIASIKCCTVAFAERARDIAAKAAQPPPQRPLRARNKQPQVYEHRVAAGGKKSLTTCPRCKRTVRRDVIRRHWATQKCRLASAMASQVEGAAGRSANRPAVGEQREQCCHCGSSFVASQRKRHLKSIKCMEARALAGAAPGSAHAGQAST